MSEAPSSGRRPKANAYIDAALDVLLREVSTEALIVRSDRRVLRSSPRAAARLADAQDREAFEAELWQALDSWCAARDAAADAAASPDTARATNASNATNATNATDTTNAARASNASNASDLTSDPPSASRERTAALQSHPPPAGPSPKETRAALGKLEAIELPGCPDHYLLMRRTWATGPRPTLEDALEVAKRDWQLTGRQTEVLGHVAIGRSNQAIANTIGCAASTVEIHVSVLLRKSHCESRSALIARFWADIYAGPGNRVSSTLEHGA